MEFGSPIDRYARPARKPFRIWLDDVRPKPKDFDVHVRTAAEAIALLKSGAVETISLDHDLGHDENGGEAVSGYAVACWIEEEAHAGRLKPLMVLIHSMNPVGRARMAAAIESARRAWK
jgi:hypothetical protein